MKVLKSFFVVLTLMSCNYAVAQHGISPAWGDSVVLPKNNPAASARTTVGTTMVVDKRGKVTILYKEQVGQDTDLYLNSSSDGKSWTPQLFQPARLTGNAGGYNVAIDAADNIHAVWVVNTRSRFNLYYSRYNHASGQWSPDTLRIYSSAVDTVEFPAITVDRKMRVHVVWHDVNATNRVAEVRYVRSPDNGTTWEAAQNLSNSPTNESLFPRADLSGVSSDTVAFAWREYVGGANAWDVIMAYSIDGGQTWSSNNVTNAPGAQWDPGLVVDKHNVIHIHFHEYPATGDPEPFVQIKYGKTTDPGASPIYFKRISDAVRSQLTIFAYDYTNDIHWIFWKDERDFVNNADANADVACRYSNDGGNTWQSEPLEFITDLGDAELGYKKCAVGVDGTVHLTYEIPPTGTTAIYYKRRPKPLTTRIDAIARPENLPDRFQLFQNYPNPFNPSTVISFQLPVSSHVTLKVFDVNGREVATLVEGNLAAGNHRVTFAPRDLAGGIYFYSLTTGSFKQTRKAVLIK